MIKVPEPIIGAAYDSLVAIVSRCGSDKQKFLDDTTLQDATLMRLVDAGEHLARIRDHFEDYYANHSSASWNNLIGLSNIITKSYDLDRVWLIIHNDLPTLIAELRQLI